MTDDKSTSGTFFTSPMNHYQPANDNTNNSKVSRGKNNALKVRKNKIHWAEKLTSNKEQPITENCLDNTINTDMNIVWNNTIDKDTKKVLNNTIDADTEKTLDHTFDKDTKERDRVTDRQPMVDDLYKKTWNSEKYPEFRCYRMKKMSDHEMKSLTAE